TSRLHPPPASTLFPYTTLFRSRLQYPGGKRRRDDEPGQERGGEEQARGEEPTRHRGRVARARRARQGSGVRRATRRFDCASRMRSEEHTSELQSRFDLVCRLLL